MVNIYLKATHHALMDGRTNVALAMLRLALAHANRTKDKRVSYIMRAFQAVRRIP